jgi:hypothetical protein
MANRTLQAAIILVFALLTGLSAQQRGRISGNPTPGTPQPDPPNLADRITVSGCVRMAAQGARGTVAPADLNTPSDSTFILVDAVRETRVPPGTGTSETAKKATSRTYRLAAINSALVPFVGSKVEVSGEVDASTLASPGPQGPILRVAFVQRVSKTCS